MYIDPQIVEATSLLTGYRRELHAHPELGYEVHRTADFVAQKLESWGIEVTRRLGQTGLVGRLKRGSGPRTIGLRADMDALPIREMNGFEHRSTVPGVMHACGHDGHVAMLLGAARHLAKFGEFDGTVNFIFQPAEEGLAGGKAMVEDGLFDRFPCDAIFGVHNWPGLPTGYIGSRPGPLMAASAVFKITVTGTASHAAMPHLSNDALLAASSIVVGLQSIISRNTDPIDSAVVSVCMIGGGTANNVIAKGCGLSGAVRTFSDTILKTIGERIRDIASSIAIAHGCTSCTEYTYAYPATVNDEKMTDFAMQVAEKVVGSDRTNVSIKPTMAGEDFAYMLAVRPGCYAFIGNGDGSHRALHNEIGPCELHNDNYDFNDEILPVGVAYFSALVENFLAQ